MDLVIDTISVEQIDSGKLAFPSRVVLMGDPCYFAKIDINQIRSFIASDQPYEMLDLCLLIRLPEHDEVNIETGHVDNRVGSWSIRAGEIQPRKHYTSEANGKSLSVMDAAFLGVDSGQMAAIDAQVFLNQWADRDYDMRQTWSHKETGKMLTYPLDFINYEAPIPAYDGKTMNELNATGEWEQLPYQGAIDWSYNGLSHAHDNRDDIAIVGEAGIVTGTGWGDGCYEVLLNAKDNVVTDFGITFIEEDDAEEVYDDDDEENED